MTDPLNKTLFLGDVSSFCTEAELEELFSQHGKVIEVKISGTSRGISLCYGFVTMAERSQAEEAMEKLQGVVLRGRAIRINWAARNVRDNNSYSSTNDMINSIHVRYRTLQRMATPFTEENLKLIFEQYGTVVDASIKNSFVDQYTGIQRGYGFVHFEKTVEGMKAAVLAAQNETGDLTVTLECEVSKNLIKCSTYLSLSGNLNKVEPTTTPRPGPTPEPSPLIKTTVSLDDMQPEVYYNPPMMRWTTCNEEQIYEQISGHENVYYANSVSSLDSSPNMCYAHPSPIPMRPIYLTPWKPHRHQVMTKNQGSYPTIITDEYIPAEMQIPMCQQMAYSYPEQQQQQSLYMQVRNNNTLSGTMTDAESSAASSPSVSCEQITSTFNINASEEMMQSSQTEYVSYVNGPTSGQGYQPPHVQAHLTRSYPSYQGHPIQTQQPVMQQSQPYIYQSLLMSSSPQMSSKVFYPTQTAASSCHFDDGQIRYSPDVSQTLYYPQGTYSQHMYPSPVPIPYHIHNNMSMTYPPNQIPQDARQYSTLYTSIVENHNFQDQSLNQNLNVEQVHHAPFRKKATATLQRFKALV